MSKTNKERLQDNNLELEDIKTKVDDLPEYQDIEPIYTTIDPSATQVNLSDSSISYTAGNFYRYGYKFVASDKNLLIYSISTNTLIYTAELEDFLTNNITSVSASMKIGNDIYFHIFTKDDKKVRIFIWNESNNNITLCKEVDVSVIYGSVSYPEIYAGDIVASAFSLDFIIGAYLRGSRDTTYENRVFLDTGDSFVDYLIYRPRK